jgi:hypothetical protein
MFLMAHVDDNEMTGWKIIKMFLIMFITIATFPLSAVVMSIMTLFGKSEGEQKLLAATANLEKKSPPDDEAVVAWRLALRECEEERRHPRWHRLKTTEWDRAIDSAQVDDTSLRHLINKQRTIFKEELERYRAEKAGSSHIL